MPISTTLLLGVITLSLLAAMSPVLFFNSAELVAGQGASAGARYFAGASVVLVVIATAGAGLLGAGLSTWISREISSRIVDGVLAVVLLIYGLVQLRALHRQREGAAAPSSSGHSAFGNGVVGMITNYTTLPLVLAASQHVGSAHLAFYWTIPLVALIVLITALPTWVPLALAKLAPHLLAKLHGHKHGQQPGIGAWIPIIACFLGSLALAAHAAGILGTH